MTKKTGHPSNGRSWHSGTKTGNEGSNMKRFLIVLVFLFLGFLAIIMMLLPLLITLLLLGFR